MLIEGLGDGELLGGRYRIICQLGEGGMAVVYLACDTQATGAEVEHPVAIKIPLKKVLDDPTATERFERETRRQFSHPHIVPILDVGDHEGLPYVVMQYCAGGSLRHRRQRDGQGRPLPGPPEMLHQWLPAVAAALDHVHANGSVHRDVKPANIFFDAYWHAFLGDFGVAKKIDESYDPEDPLTTTNMGVGTSEYMAPEQCARKPVIDGRTDQYALAVVVYEMLAGKRPYTGATAHPLVEMMTKPVPSLAEQQSGLPRTLVDAVHRGLSKTPGERFPTCRQFAAAALRDVPHVLDQSGLVRLLCLACRKVIPLPQDRRGQAGRCPQCKARVRVADDLSALWPQDDAWLRAPAPQEAGSGPAWTPIDVEQSDSKRHGPRSPRSRARGPATRRTSFRIMVGTLAALAVILAGVTFANWLVHTESWAYRNAWQTVAAKRGVTLQQRREAYAVIGRYHCLVERRWDAEGLDAYVKSELYGFKDCARTEQAVGSGKGRSGRLFEAAERWWYLSGNPNNKIRDPRYDSKRPKRPLNPYEITSLRLHVKELYDRAFAYRSEWSDEDRQKGKKLYESDENLRKLVNFAQP